MALYVDSSSVKGCKEQTKITEETIVSTRKYQSFINEGVLVGVINVSIRFFFKVNFRDSLAYYLSIKCLATTFPGGFPMYS